MSAPLSAAMWGWIAGSSLLIGTALGWYLNLSTKVISSVMAFGAGVLISAISFELMDEAFKRGGPLAAGLGFLIGIFLYTLGARVINKRGGKFRKRSGEFMKENDSNAKAIALGAFLDGIPESIVIGLSLLAGKGPSFVTVFAVFISNVPEGLSSSSGMKRAGHSFKYVFGLWTSIVLMSGIASYIGYAVFGKLSIDWVAALTALAAGAILSMIVDTMIPEAYEEERDWAGVITGLGFLVAFITAKLTEGPY